MAEFPRRSFLVLVAGIAVGSFRLPELPGSEEIAAPGTAPSVPPPPRQIFEPPMKLPMGGNRFALMWMEKSASGKAEMMLWPAETPEELADAQRLYETSRNYPLPDEPQPGELPPARSAAETALVERLLDDPRDRELRRAYANLLTALGDPVGARVTLVLEEESLPADDPRRRQVSEKIDGWNKTHGEAVWEPLRRLGIWPCHWGEFAPDAYMEFGFVCWLRLTRPDLLPRHDAYLRRVAPAATLLDVDGERIELEDLARSSLLEQIRHLVLRDCVWSSTGFAELMFSPHLKRLRILDLPRNTAADAVEPLATAPAARRLTDLYWYGEKLSADRFEQLLEGDWSRLEVLRMLNALECGPLTRLAACPTLTSLRELELGYARSLTAAAWESWRGTALPETLEYLDVSSGEFEPEAFSRLASLPFRRLKRLKLAFVELTAEAIADLRQAAWLPGLSELDLNGCGAAAGAMLAAPELRAEVLRFGLVPLTAAEFDAFLRSERPAALRTLELHLEEHSPERVGDLVKASDWTALRELTLGKIDLDRAAATALIEAPFASRLTALHVLARDESVASLLRERYSDEVLRLADD